MNLLFDKFSVDCSECNIGVYMTFLQESEKLRQAPTLTLQLNKYRNIAKTVKCAHKFHLGIPFCEKAFGNNAAIFMTIGCVSPSSTTSICGANSTITCLQMPQG